jgi:hypothetical protein
MRLPVELGAVEPPCSDDQFAASVQLCVAHLDDAQVRPGLWANPQDLPQDALRGDVGQSLSKDQCHRRGGTRNASVAVHQKMRVPGRFCQQVAPKGEKLRDVVPLRHRHVGAVLLNHIVEAQFEPGRLAEIVKGFRYGPVWVQDRKYVRDVRPAVGDQLLNATDADPERCDKVHRLRPRMMLIDVDLANPRRTNLPRNGRATSLIIRLTESVPVPDDAVIFHQGQVFVPVVRHSVVHLAPLTLGYDNGYAVEVTDVSASDRVALNTGHAAIDNELVQPFFIKRCASRVIEK